MASSRECLHPESVSVTTSPGRLITTSVTPGSLRNFCKGRSAWRSGASRSAGTDASCAAGLLIGGDRRGAVCIHRTKVKIPRNEHLHKLALVLHDRGRDV